MLSQLLPRAVRGPNHDYTRVVLISDARTGSTWLQSLLGSHPEVLFFYEPFHPEEVKLGSPLPFPGALGVLREIAPTAFARSIAEAGRPSHVRAVGFKLLFEGHRKFPEVESHLGTLDRVFVLRLTRRVLPRLCSLALAHRTARWHDTTGSVVRRGRVRFETGELETAFLREEKAAEFIERSLAGKPGLRLSYEALCADPHGEAARILAALSLKERELRSPLRKLENRRPREILENFEELKRHFAGSRWESHFE